MNIEYKETPWPHFVGSLDEEMYYHAFKLWETDEKLKSYNISKNRSNIEIKDDILVNYLHPVIRWDYQLYVMFHTWDF